MKRKFAGICAAWLMISGAAAQAAPELLELTSRAACVINADTGKCLYEFNADEPLAPASMTKVMTAYLVYKKIGEGVLSKDTMITADAEDEEASFDYEATNVPLIEGEAYSVDELLGAVLVPSACAASAMLGKYLCGSEAEFAKLMNKTVGELKLEAYYDDASGLSDNNRISARSMAELTRRLIKEYPDVLNYTSKPSVSFDGVIYKSTNKMLQGGAYEFSGTDGVKTGTTTLAGCCNTSTAVRDGVRMISVTMHSESGSARFEDSGKLLEFGFEKEKFLRENIFATDMKMFINGNEMPAFCRLSPEEGLCIIIEDMKDYGFDIEWDPGTNTVTARRNEKKVPTPIAMDTYRGYLPGSELFRVVSRSVKARIVCGDREYEFKDVCNVDGYTMVTADELKDAFSGVWEQEDRSLRITVG